MINAIKMNPLVKELRETFRVKYGVSDAEVAMCHELIALNVRMIELERLVSKMDDKFERELHRSFHRLPPHEPPKAPSLIKTPFLQDNAITDEWIETGRETEAA